jgi:hypothetical protein
MRAQVKSLGCRSSSSASGTAIKHSLCLKPVPLPAWPSLPLLRVVELELLLLQLLRGSFQSHASL